MCTICRYVDLSTSNPHLALQAAAGVSSHLGKHYDELMSKIDRRRQEYYQSERAVLDRLVDEVTTAAKSVSYFLKLIKVDETFLKFRYAVSVGAVEYRSEVQDITKYLNEQYPGWYKHVSISYSIPMDKPQFTPEVTLKGIY